MPDSARIPRFGDQSACEASNDSPAHDAHPQGGPNGAAFRSSRRLPAWLRPKAHLPPFRGPRLQRMLATRGVEPGDGARSPRAVDSPASSASMCGSDPPGARRRRGPGSRSRWTTSRPPCVDARFPAAERPARNPAWQADELRARLCALDRRRRGGAGHAAGSPGPPADQVGVGVRARRG